jgi:hypothetical protein
VRPADDAEKAAFGALMAWSQSLREWGDAGWERARVAAKAC